MLNATLRRTKIVLVLSVMFILSALAPASLAGRPDAVVVVDYAVEGSVVHVTVKNLSKKPQNVEVHVYATVGGVEVKGYTPVSLASRGTASTVVGFIQTIENVETVGIIETAEPQ